MTRVYRKIDYCNATNAIKNSLSPLKDSLSNLSSKISSYHAIASNELSGEAYDIILKRLNLYSNAVANLSKSIDIFTNNAESANNAVINAIGEFDSVSDEEVEDLDTALNNLAIFINNFTSSYNNIKNGKNNVKESANKNVSALDTNDNSKEINSRYATLNFLKQKKAKIEEALNNAESADNSGVEGITGIEAVISGILQK